MKFLTSPVVALLIASSEATQISAMRHHNHYPSHYEYIATLPDVRADTVSDEDIAAHEAARAEAAKALKNPQNAVLATIKTDLDQISKDLSFGVSYSQSSRNDHARTLCTKVATAITDYATNLLATVEAGPNETMTEQNAHNIAAMIFYDVQVQDFMTGLG